MRAMRDSGVPWIGEVPAGWEVAQAQMLFHINSGATPDSGNSEYWDGEIRWITPADYKTEQKVVFGGSRNLTDAGLASCSAKIVPQGSIIVSKRAPVGTVAIAGAELATNQGCLACIPKQDCIDTTFYYYVMAAANAELNRCGNGTTFSEISLLQFSSVPLPLPPLPEQRRIAEWLDERCAAIDAAVEAARASIEEYEAYKKSVIACAVTRGLDPQASEWKTVQFKRIARVCANLVQPSDYLELMEVDPDNIEKDSGRIVNVRTVEEVGAISAKHLFFKGQILYSKIRPTLNKVAIAPYNGLCSADMYPIETTQDSRWLMYAMLSNEFVEQVALGCARVKMPKINVMQLGQIKLQVPPLPEQRAIAAYLDSRTSAIDAVVAQKRAIAEDLLAYRKSLIYEAVTGKREV